MRKALVFPAMLFVAVLAGCDSTDSTTTSATPSDTSASASAPAPAASCAAPSNPRVDNVAKVGPDDFNASGTVQQTPSCLEYIDVSVGSGASPQTGQKVTVQYTGWLTTGVKFDSSRDRGQPFTFTIGQGQVIAGWDEGVATMKVGGRRKLIIPAQLGYGAAGSPPVIPANATLVFMVELVSVG